LDQYVVYSTEAGSILLKNGDVVSSSKDASQLFEKAKQMGAKAVSVSNEKEAELARGSGLEASLMGPTERQKLDLDKVALIVKSKLAPNEAAALEIIRQRSISAAEESIRESSSRPDLHLVQAIQALDDTDKFLNVTSTRVSEWYGLHFPESLQLVADNLALSRLVVELGRRDGFTAESLAGKGFSDKKVEAMVAASERSKGGVIADPDLGRVRALATLAIELSSERDKLNSYVEGAMKRIAPNVTEVAGATIGARLMAKAGGLDRLAVLPASTIQILGAEKALFRALRTGARPPKHGILFQHQEVHMAPKWQRGKIARTLANKIAIAARVDFYRGTEDPSLKAGLQKRLEQIKEKYKEPPSPSTRPPKEWRGRERGRPDRGQRRGGFDRKKKFQRR
jgi:nucleolar protein 56